MKILYVAMAVVAPGSHGGATHVVEVASELAKLGHELHVVCAYEGKESQAELLLPVEGGLTIHFYRFRRSDKAALLRYPQLVRLAANLKPDLVMERYYNFAGIGLLYARRHKLPSILEVNALMVDPPGSFKYRMDGLLLRRMEWWATRQCEWAGRIVTPLHTTVPAKIPRTKIAELPWGANVDRFDPANLPELELVKLRRELGLPSRQDGARVAVFAGSFRHWHGVEKLVEAALQLVPTDPLLYFLLLGGGPELETIRALVRQHGLEERILTPGAVAHSKIPLYLALADCGVAPFDTSKHLPLRHAGFFWSPLKIFEYMAMKLPTITIDLPPLNQIIRPGQEGLLFKEGDVSDLAQRLQELLAPGAEAEHCRETMGRLARQRVVEHFSWASHVRALDRLIAELTSPAVKV
ncbi:MAG: glycosyltransferase family 4 protein [Chloroflexota bacterium]